MEQVIPQSKVGNKSAAYRRMGWFMAVILVLVLCAAGSLAWFNINMAETSLKQDVERRLQFTAQNKASALSLWFNSMQNQANRLISADLFRLFASEVNGLGNDLSTLLNASGDTSSGIDDLSQLASQLPLMKNLLQEFISYSGFLRARITNTDAQTYLSTDVTPPALSLEQQQGIRKTVESGKLGILPVRKTSNGLVLDLVVPIFAPQYVEGRSEKPVATLLLSLMVSSRLGETIDAVKGEGSFGVTHVFQIVGDKLQDLLPLSADIQNLPGWQLGQNDSLPFGIRKGASGSHEAVYSIGVKVPELPWLVVQEVPVAAALKPFLSQRNAIVIWAVIAVVVVLLALLAVWWWLVGRNARNVSAELLQLYQISNQQKQLLDGINSALVDGIVLTDKGGMVQYANQAFAHMVGRSDEELVGMDCAAIFGYDTALRLYKQLDVAIQSGQSFMFKDVMWLQSKKYHYQITCSPYRNESGVITGTVSVFRDITQLVDAQERNQRMERQTIAAFMHAIEAVDPYLGGQSSYMANLGGDLVKTLGLSEEDESTVRTAASLSQIGKMQLPRELLTKPGAFTPEERQAMERHVEYARDTLKNINFELPVVEAISQMNEFLDGSGYPEKLHGDKISIHGRILSVANTFCALIRPRSYRNAKSVDVALHILESESAKYDQHVVHALREYLKTPAGEKFVRSLADENV
ncbi:HD domain-containing phosphohydrolase [uncultured Bilophila sp.]|uniref:HD domain-containing phosphohydrolase n=1 Tax=uncultured Bilophila sp. TaxID=529385 RepID=UPI00280BD167|nr:HD domain-containing phosphohydrolase [uncultured Bilophila sp.]